MTGSHTVQLLLQRGHTVRVLAHNEDDRSMRLQELGAEVVIGDLLNLNDVRLALSGIRGAYFVYPPGLIVGTPAGLPLGIAHPQNGACRPGGSNGHGRSAKKAAAIMVGLFGPFDRIHWANTSFNLRRFLHEY